MLIDGLGWFVRVPGVSGSVVVVVGDVGPIFRHAPFSSYVFGAPRPPAEPLESPSLCETLDLIPMPGLARGPALLLLLLVRCADCYPQRKLLDKPTPLLPTINPNKLPSNPQKLTQTLTKLRKQKNAHHAHSVLLHSLDTRPHLVNTLHCNIVLAALSDQAQWDLALALLSHMEKQGFTPDAYSFSAVICACARADQPDAAVRTFKDMCASDVEKSTVVFNSALMACQRAGRHSLLIAIHALYSLEVVPDVWASGAAIRALTHMRQFNRAIKLYTNLRPGQRDTYSVSAALNAAISARRWDLATLWYDEARHAGIKVDAHMLDAALRACAFRGGGGWRRALGLLSSERAIADSRCYTTAMRALSADGRWRESIKLLQHLESSDSNSATVHAYCSAISSLRQSKRWRMGLVLLARMRRNGLQPDAYCISAALEVCDAADRWEEALSLIKDMSTFGLEPSSIHLTPVLRCCTRAGRPKDALALIETVVESSKQSPPLDAIAISAAMVACAKCGDSWRTHQLLSLVEETGGELDVKARCSAINALGRGGDIGGALRLLGGPGESSRVDTACYNAALGCLRRAGEFELSERLVASMGREGRPSPNHITAQVMTLGQGSSRA